MSIPFDHDEPDRLEMDLNGDLYITDGDTGLTDEQIQFDEELEKELQESEREYMWFWDLPMD